MPRRLCPYYMLLPFHPLCDQSSNIRSTVPTTKLLTTQFSSSRYLLPLGSTCSLSQFRFFLGDNWLRSMSINTTDKVKGLLTARYNPLGTS